MDGADVVEARVLDEAEVRQRMRRSGRKAELAGLGLQKLPSLPGYGNVTELRLPHNALIECEGVALLTALRVLDVSHNRIERIDFVLPATLRWLDASHNPPLQRLTNVPSAATHVALVACRCLAFPPLARRDKPLRGRRLKHLKAWLETHGGDATYRLASGRDAGPPLHFSYAVASDPVVNKPMEDRHLHHAAPPRRTEGEADKAGGDGPGRVVGARALLYAVADGHSGAFVADCATAQLAQRLERVGAFDTADGDEAARLLRQAVAEMDRELCDVLQSRNMNDGSTLAMALVLPDGLVVTGWLGDSRIIVCHANGTATPLTVDHKPHLKEERARIEAAGGFVSNLDFGCARVNNILAMSRALGDVTLKRPLPLVSAELETAVYRLRPGADVGIVLASDGLWDVASQELTARIVRRATSAHAAAEKLLWSAKFYGTRDNTLVMVVCPFL